MSFPDAAAEALRAVSGYRVSDEQVDHVLAGFVELPAHPDAEPAMDALAASGVRMICPTNGSADTTRAFLHRTGLAGYIENVISAGGDCHGAKPAGLTTGWASRSEQRYGALFAPADVTGADLVEVADGLLAPPTGARAE